MTKKNLPLKVIAGGEYLSNCGDIIGLFLKDEIIEKDWQNIIDKIHSQNGLAILPHPYYAHKNIEEIASKVDAIEVYNSRCTEEQNRKALELAKKMKKPIIAGIDAHLPLELRNGYNVIGDGDDIRTSILNIKKYEVRSTSYFNIIHSQIIKAYKQKDVRLFLKQLKSIISFTLIQPIRRLMK